MKQIALIKTGCTIERIKPEHGDFEDWFAEGLGVSDLLQIDVFSQQPLPAPETLAGIAITGSPAMVSARQDWSERTAEWLRLAVKTDIPVLGVCYGHQLLAHALGGRAGPNPAGRQIGTVTSQLIDNIEDDPLLGLLQNAFPAQTSLQAPWMTTLRSGFQIKPGVSSFIRSFLHRSCQITYDTGQMPYARKV